MSHNYTQIQDIIRKTRFQSHTHIQIKPSITRRGRNRDVECLKKLQITKAGCRLQIGVAGKHYLKEQQDIQTK